MTALLEMSLPANYLAYCLNAAVASVVACALAVVLSRRQAWSLPARHAILVAAIAGSLLAPLVIPLVHLPSPWAIHVSEALGQPRMSVETKTTESNHREEVLESPVPMSPPVAEFASVNPVSAEPKTISPASVVPELAPHGPSREQLSLSATQRTRIIGTLVCGIWLVGIVCGVARALVCLVKLRRWTQTVTVAACPELASAARSAADGLGWRKEIVIYRSCLLPAPITFGLLRPRIVVPAGIESDLSREQLRAVIQHEVAHLARRDLWTGLLQQIAQV
ncbi:MAG: M56 family metallopeptidase, partial [Pirellulaceae bacterium]|nr:M56 family metallopeptidase [Pirellulaceae bacterium]